jgi:hypothetical protein
MYEYLDRRVTSLDKGGQFLIWSMRSWVRALSERQCPGAWLGPAFAKWSVLTALPQFHAFMAILNRDALEALSFCQLTCQRVSEHEAILLSLFRRSSCEERQPIRDTIALLVDEVAVEPLFDALTQASIILVDAELLPIAVLAINLEKRVTDNSRIRRGE